MSISCQPQDLAASAKCFQCLPRGMLLSVRTYLLCQWANAACSDPLVDDWVARITSGGQTVSESSILAVCEFVRALRVGGLFNSIVLWNPIIPDSLGAMAYPFDTGLGLPWINHNFLAADLNVNGLKGSDVGAKYFETGFVPNVPLGNQNSGITIVESEIGVPILGAGVSFGSHHFDGSDELSFWLSCHDSGFFGVNGPMGSSYSVPAGDFVSWVAADAPRLVSINRTGINELRLFVGQGGVINQVAFNPAVFNTDLPMDAAYFMAMHFVDDTGPTDIPAYFTVKRISFVAVHVGLTQAQLQIFYNAINTLRVALGGGSV